VAVRCLGDFSVEVGGEPVERWRAGKTRSLFLFLLVNRDRLVLRERLNEELWPGVEWSRNSSSLKVAVHALRQILNGGLGPDGKPAVRIVHQDHGYLLQGNRIWVDFEEFEGCFDAARAAETRGEEEAALRLYRRAMDLYSGEFLPGETADWVRGQREWTKSLALRVMDRLRADAFGRGEHAEVLAWCRRILDIDPYREETYRLIMHLHAGFGELGRVNSWYQLCVQRLRDELGVEPTAATRRVFDAAMRGDGRTGSAPAARLTATRQPRSLTGRAAPERRPAPTPAPRRMARHAV
jgi:two-component SAPR family response regulator